MTDSRRRFECKGAVEWGGVSVEFADGSQTRSLGFVKDSSMFKFSESNRKGTFGVDRVEAVVYRSSSPDGGHLSVRFGSPPAGLDASVLDLGAISLADWERFRDNIRRYVAIVE